VVGWAEQAVVYQIYVRSFVDSDGDGVGDLAGLRSRLDYLVDLGIDAIWPTSFFRSPMVDGGYDVADYRDVDPRLGTLAEADALLREAHRCGLRVIMDLVPNHTSAQHRWFQEALATRSRSTARQRYVFRPGRGRHGAEPPNNWRSVFGGPAWTRLPDGEWYLHLFAPEQPDLNWENPQVRAEFVDILRFWLDRGVDGFRVDVAHGLVKPAGLPDAAHPGGRGNRPYFDQDGVHEIYREWRTVLDAYQPRRVLVAEARLRDIERTAQYVRAGEHDQAFNFEFLWTPWSAARIRAAISRSLAAMGAVGRLPTWVIGNHDEIRVASRLAAGTATMAGTEWSAQGMRATDAGSTAVGLRRARAMALLSLALPGSAYVYQGDELGLPEVVDLPDEVREDPVWHRSGGVELGRDGCRVPMPWSGDRPPYGFGPSGSAPPWLPQPPSWRTLSVAAQRRDPGSVLSMYRAALRQRRTCAALRGMDLVWLPTAPEVLAFTRGATFACVVNVGPRAASLAGLDLPGPLALASAPIERGDDLPPETAAWFCRLDGRSPEPPGGARSGRGDRPRPGQPGSDGW
jgi:alpha-glucosidase